MVPIGRRYSQAGSSPEISEKAVTICKAMPASEIEREDEIKTEKEVSKPALKFVKMSLQQNEVVRCNGNRGDGENKWTRVERRRAHVLVLTSA